MGTESTLTSPTGYVPRPWERVTLAEQRQALAALDRITELHPNLPGAYIVLSLVVPTQIDVQAQSWTAFEAWREALNVPPADVQLGNCEPVREHIAFEAVVDGVTVKVYMMGDLRAQAVAEGPAVGGQVTA
ncbi:hypothetical protein ACH4ND_01325 [Streptomyces sp. NPDC017179]|uniref:hypothetical protein n=1 Tax=Streptomyces sp. NPDC017179 TaxID=3364979 RepID=UPI00379777A5